MFDPRALCDEQAGKEGPYSNDPDDPGGETAWGWTKAAARAFGYTGDMKDLTRQQAVDMYVDRYWQQPKLDQVQLLSDDIARKLLEIGINLGPSTGIGFMQRALNVLNNRGTIFPDISADGGFGKMTAAALKAYLDYRRADDGEQTLLEMIKALQSVRYIETAEKNAVLEKYEFGWQHNRV